MSRETNTGKNQIRMYLIFVLGICWVLGIAAFCLQENSQNTIYQILQKGFTAFPVIAAVLTRRITRDKFVQEDTMALNIAEAFELLFDKNNNVAYKALQNLQRESQETDCVYPYMDRLSDMLDSDNSYIRTRGLTLLAYNAKWDKDYKIDEIIDKYLKHITDVKPITARQCIKLLPLIARYKPELKNDILSALYKANICVYDDSMQPLVYKDIQKALKEIQKL